MLIPPENVPSETVGRPSSGCSSASKREVLEPADRPRELVDRVLAQVRHRAVRGLAARDRVGPHDALVRDARVVRGRLGHQHRAAAARAARRRRASASAPSQPVSSPAHSTSSRPADGEPPERRHPLGGDDDRRRPALHVARPAPEQPVAVGLAGERVDRPVRLPQRHGVEVPGQAQRRPVADTPQRATSDTPPGVELVRLDREPGRLQARPDQRRGLGLVAGRVDGAGRDELARELDDVGAHRVPTGSGAALRQLPSRRSARGRRRPPRRRGPSPSARRAPRTGARCRAPTTASCRGSSPGTRSGSRRSPGCRAPATPAATSRPATPGSTG